MGWLSPVFPLCLAFLLLCPQGLWAQYTIVLKNGRRITVQSYREEGRTIKVFGLGVEIALGRDQVQSILRAGETGEHGVVFPGLEELTAAQRAAQLEETEATIPAPAKNEAEEKPVKLSQNGERVLTPQEQLAREERNYQARIVEVTTELKRVLDRYLRMTRGTSSPDPTLLQDEEAIRARTDDLISRLRDIQHSPVDPRDADGLRVLTPSLFAGLPPSLTELRPEPRPPTVNVPPPPYNERQRELSALRKEIGRLEKERERLVQEMRQKGFKTSGVFLE